jgi:hypothetical protein
MNRIEELEKELKLLREIEELKNKPKYEVGKWYKADNNALVCYTGSGDNRETFEGYGFNIDGWNDSTPNWARVCFKDEATNEEVQTALIKEAEKRGFKEGVMFKSAFMGNKYQVAGFEIDSNCLHCKGNSGCIFDGDTGKWATIIDTPLTINGKTVTIGKEFVSVGCKTLEHKAFKQFVSDLTFFNITDFNHPEVGNVTTKQFQEIVDKIE